MKKPLPSPRYPSQTNSGAIASQFSVAPVVVHDHNGINSPRVNYNDLIDKPTTAAVYGGQVISNAAGTFFPKGWTVTNNTGGNITVTHNLGTTSYSVVATAKYNGTGATYTAYIEALTSNSFNVQTLYSTSGIGTAADFTFILTTS